MKEAELEMRRREREEKIRFVLVFSILSDDRSCVLDCQWCDTSFGTSRQIHAHVASRTECGNLSKKRRKRTTSSSRSSRRRSKEFCRYGDECGEMQVFVAFLS